MDEDEVNDEDEVDDEDEDEDGSPVERLDLCVHSVVGSDEGHHVHGGRRAGEGPRRGAHDRAGRKFVLKKGCRKGQKAFNCLVCAKTPIFI